ncbi:hypothetical protein M0802_001829 [Mischocyttarus mexicanus]|nr:hypothetical protein M0802_001829 [Mischocyttarus mexicanus]
MNQNLKPTSNGSSSGRQAAAAANEERKRNNSSCNRRAINRSSVYDVPYRITNAYINDVQQQQQQQQHQPATTNGGAGQTIRSSDFWIITRRL